MTRSVRAWRVVGSMVLAWALSSMASSARAQGTFDPARCSGEHWRHNGHISLTYQEALAQCQADVAVIEKRDTQICGDQDTFCFPRWVEFVQICQASPVDWRRDWASGLFRTTSIRKSRLSNGTVSGVEQGEIYQWKCKPHPDATEPTPDPIIPAPDPDIPDSDVDKTLGQAPEGNDVGDPIDTATGNVYRQELDAEVGRWLRFTRAYNSGAHAAGGILGPHWTHAYDRHITAMASSAGISHARLTDADGRVLTFRLIDGVWHAENDVIDTLEWEFSRGEPQRWTVRRTGSPRVDTFDAEGRLSSFTTDDGVSIALGYREGRLSTLTDPSGRTLALDYDSSGRLQQLRSPDGSTVAYAYDAEGQLASVTYPGGQQRQYRYDEPDYSGAPAGHRLTRVLDAHDAALATYRYQADGRATTTALAAGTQAYTVAYHADGRSTTTDPYGTDVTRQYAVIGGVPRVTALSGACASCGPTQAIAYDTHGQPVTRTNFACQRTSLTYDAKQREIARTDAEGTEAQRTLLTTWGAESGQREAQELRDATGQPLWRTVQRYSISGQPSTRCVIDPAQAPDYTCEAFDFMPAPAGVQRWSIFACPDALEALGCPFAGLPMMVFAPGDQLTQYSYYTQSDTTGCGRPGGACHQPGDLHQITRAGFSVIYTALSYDRLGHVTRWRDAHGTLTDAVYHPRGWLLEQTVRARADGAPDANDAVTRYTHDDEGRVLSRTDADGVTLRYHYDAAHRLTDVVDAQGNRQRIAYDADNRPLTEQLLDTAGAVIAGRTHHYDALGRLQETHDATRQRIFQATAYDPLGRLLASTDALGREQRQRVDALGRIVSQTADSRGLAAETVFVHDAADRLEGIADPDGLLTSYDTNGLGQSVATHSPDTGDTQRRYDDAGQLITQTDARGVEQRYSYDMQGRLTSQSFSDGTPTRSLSYGEANALTGCTGSVPGARLTRIQQGDAITAYCYDARGQIIAVRQTQGDAAAAVTDVTRYAYTPAGRVRQILTPTGSITDTVYDAAGRIASINVTTRRGETMLVASGITYRADGSVAGYRLGNGQQVTRQFDGNGRISAIDSGALQLALEYDAAGQVTAISEEGQRYRYAYDGLGRLVDVIDPAGRTRQQLTYNGTGDRLSKTGEDQATEAYRYQDATHRLIATGGGTRNVDAAGNTTATQASEAFQYAYDAEGQLITVERNGQPVAQYTYNGRGERIGKQVRLPVPMRQRFTYDGASQLLAELGDDARDYVWLGDIPVAVIEHGAGSEAVRYIHADHLGTPRAVTDGARETIWAWKLAGDPFGEHAPNTSGYTFNLRFPGQYFDAETGLHYNVRRFYDTGSGRYITSDPIGLEAGLSTYGYVNGNPLIVRDSLGLKADTDLCAGLSAKGCMQVGNTHVPDYVVVNVTVPYIFGFNYSVNIRNANIYGGGGLVIGGPKSVAKGNWGVSISSGTIITLDEVSALDFIIQAKNTDEFLKGGAFGVSYYRGVGGGIVTNGKNTALEVGFGIGGVGGGYQQSGSGCIK